MREVKKTLVIVLCAALAMIGSACGGDDDDHGGGGGRAPVVFDHNFVNGVSGEGDAPVDSDPLGPAVNDVLYNSGSRSVVVQGDNINLDVTFTHTDPDLIAPTLVLQIMGLAEYWTFDASQFGMFDNTSAMVRVNLSPDFEPGTYILMVGIMDDAGHVQDLFYRLFIVLPYVIPEILEMLPEDGDTNVAINTGVIAEFSDPVVGDPPAVTLTRNGLQVPGQGHLIPNRKVVIFQPDGFLLPDTEYVATVTIRNMKTGDVKQRTHHFITDSLDPSVSTAGKVYSVKLTVDGTVEPPGAELFIGDIPPFLFKMKTFDEVGETIDSVAGLSDGGNPLNQIVMAPTWNFAGLSFLRNPYFKLGPKTLDVDLTALAGIPVMVHLYDFTLSGRFSPAGDFFDVGIISAYIDSEEINTLLGPIIGGNFNICLALPDADCDEQGRLGLHIIDMVGLYEPGIANLYDLSVNVSSDTVPDASGGVVTVSGAYLVDGDPSGVHTVDLSTTHGDFPGGGTAYSIDTAGGTYSVDLTVPSGLGVGAEITVTATSASPYGPMSRAKIVRVE